jgi:hypothetical protein
MSRRSLELAVPVPVLVSARVPAESRCRSCLRWVLARALALVVARSRRMHRGCLAVRLSRLGRICLLP